MEILEVYDDKLNPVGAESRQKVHQLGLLHKVAQCWVVSPRQDGLWIWYQQRAKNKTSFPGYYDTACAGHIAQGEQPLTAILREIQEEIGLCLEPEQLEYLGCWRESMEYEQIRDREAVEVYLYVDPAPAFRLGPEVEQMIRVSVEQVVKKEQQGAARVLAVGEKGEFWAESARFCPHWGQFEAMILPVLLERGVCG